MRMIAARSQRRAVVSIVKFRFGVGKSIDIKAVSVEIGGQVARGAEEDRRRITGLGAYLQQALNNF